MQKAKTVIVTGGARGIGEAVSRCFAKNGYNVLINYLKSEKAALEIKAALSKSGSNIEIFKADVSKREEVVKMLNFCFDVFASVDVLVNNAGVSYSSLFDTISEEEWDRVIDVNLKGTFNCCQAVVPTFIRQKSGIIVNISSIWGIVGAACEVHYSAAKSGVIGLTKALSKELGSSNIRVNCIAPGVIKTDMISDLSEADLESLRQETPLQKIGSKEDIAKAVYFLASDDAGFITGQVLSPNGGFVI